MTGRSLHDLFDDAVRDQPDGPSLESVVDADIARGHRRRRRRRTRVATCVGVVAVMAAASVAVPSLLAEQNPDAGLTDEPDPSETVLWNSELTNDVDAAVTEALPEDVTAVDGATTRTGSHGTTLTWELGRDGTKFEMTVAVDAAQPDVEAYDLCQDPHVLELELYAPSKCSAGWDEDHDRWQIVAIDDEAFLNDIVVIEAEKVAVMTSWRYLVEESGAPLSEREAVTVTDAALGAAEQYPTEEFASGIDRAGVTDVQDEIAEAVGNGIDIPLSIDGSYEPVETENPWSFTYRLRGPDRTEILVTLWERSRMYEVWCLADGGGHVCDIGPTRSAYSQNQRVWSAPVGARGGIDISIERANNYRLPPKLSLGDVPEIADLVPMLAKGEFSPGR